jgi:hypothetical protein
MQFRAESVARFSALPRRLQPGEVAFAPADGADGAQGVSPISTFSTNTQVSMTAFRPGAGDIHYVERPRDGSWDCEAVCQLRGLSKRSNTLLLAFFF